MSSLDNNYNRDYVNIIEDPFSNLDEYNVIAILTEWDDFINFDWSMIYNKIKKPSHIFDGRNILDISKIESIGFKYSALGRK